MKLTEVKYYRQGEILFVRMEGLTKGAMEQINQKCKQFGNGKVIREGEVSGHLHEVVGSGTLLEVEKRSYFRWNEESEKEDTEYESLNLNNVDLILKADDTLEIKHPEHKSLKLPKGEYFIRIQREYDEALQSRYVAD